MSIAKTLREKPAVAYGLVAALAAGAAFLLFSNSRPATSVLGSDRWAFDLNTQTLIRAAASEAAPFDVDSGPFNYQGMTPAGAGVDTLLFSCGSCADLEAGMSVDQVAAAGGRLVFVTRESDASIKNQAAAADQAGGAFASTMQGTLISDLTGKQWSGAFSPPGLRLRANAMADCPETGAAPVECLPD